jgi:ABC-type phosphate transport system substrate-binding protein
MKRFLTTLLAVVAVVALATLLAVPATADAPVDALQPLDGCGATAVDPVAQDLVDAGIAEPRQMAPPCSSCSVGTCGGLAAGSRCPKVGGGLGTCSIQSYGSCIDGANVPLCGCT